MFNGQNSYPPRPAAAAHVLRPVLRFLPPIASILLLPLLMCSRTGAGPDELVRQHDDAFVISGPSTLDIHIFGGSITVTATEIRTTRVQATVTRTDIVQYEVTRRGNSVRVTASRTGTPYGSHPSVDLEVTAPADTSLVLHTDDGTIEVHNFSLGAVISADKGHVFVDGLSGNLEAVASGGAIDVRRFAGVAHLEATNGNIQFAGRMSAGSENEMTASNGSVAIILDENPSEDDSPSVELDLEASGGEVSSDLPMRVTASSRTRLQGTVGGGKARLVVRASRGSITVE